MFYSCQEHKALRGKSEGYLGIKLKVRRAELLNIFYTYVCSAEKNIMSVQKNYRKEDSLLKFMKCQDHLYWANINFL